MRVDLKLEAKNKEEALQLASKKLSKQTGNQVKVEDLQIKLLKKGKKVLWFGNENNIYQINLKNDSSQLSKREERILATSQEISVEGDFEFRVVEQGIFIKILPPEGKGKAVSFLKVKEFLEKKKIEEINWPDIQKEVQAMQGEWVRIAPRKPELDEDARLDIEISKDKLSAFLSYTPALGGKKVTKEDIMNKLQEAGVKYGILREEIQKVIKHRKKINHLLIATGDESEPGKDAEYIFHYDFEKDSVGTERDDGSIDFFDLGLINNVQPGDVILKLIPEKEGLAGKAVTGENIPPVKPKHLDLPSGKNVEAKDEFTLIAKIAGQVVKDGKKVHVLPVHEVSGDIDLSTGNIDFLGNVIIKGNVQEGFSVKAEGNVEIRGFVSAATIKCTGDLVIQKGFVGKDKGKIDAGGDVKIKFVENGYVKAGGSIFIQDAVMHSDLSAAERIEIKAKKGLLVGGITKAGSEVEANVIGSTLATSTVLDVGLPPERKSRYHELSTKVEEEKTNLIKAKKALQLLEKMKESLGKLPADKENMFYKLKQTERRLSQNMETEEAELEELKEIISETKKGRIKVNQKVFSGVKFMIGSSQYHVKKELSRSAFVEDQGEVKQVPL